MLRLPALVLLLQLVACQTIPSGAPRPKDPTEALNIARNMLEQGQPQTAYQILHIFGHETLTLPRQATWFRLAATSLFRLKQPGEAYEVYRNFLAKNPYLPDCQPLWDLSYEIGAALLRRNSGYWIFYQDEWTAKAVLEELLTKSPKHPRRADTLHLLGELAYRNGEYKLARERFGEIITGLYDSEWATKAAFRVAMSYYRRLEGPAYDLEEMSKARTELRDFLQNQIENPSYRREAQTALTQVEEWLAAKHLQIAGFYATLDNPVGQRHHLRLGAEQFPKTKAGVAARAQLATLAARPVGRTGGDK